LELSSAFLSNTNHNTIQETSLLPSNEVVFLGKLWSFFDVYLNDTFASYFITLDDALSSWINVFSHGPFMLAIRDILHCHWL